MFYETADLVQERQDIRVSASEVDGFDTNSLNANVQSRVEVIEPTFLFTVPQTLMLLMLNLGNVNL
jgi:hypothetical protein